MFSHCRGWRQVCEILLTALKLHALTRNQDSAYICVLLYLLTWVFETIQKPMKLLAENQFPRWSTVSLTVVLPTWDNNRFYLIILFYLIRVEGENQFPGWTPVATWDTWTLRSVWSSSPGVIRPDLINVWLIQTFHFWNIRHSLCETFYLLRCQIYAWYLSGNTFAGSCEIRSFMVKIILLGPKCKTNKFATHFVS